MEPPSKVIFLVLVSIFSLQLSCVTGQGSTVLTVTLPNDVTIESTLASDTNSSTVDGVWGEWGEWHDCTASCEGGLTVRFRRCNNPPPSNGGANCTGFAMEQGACNEDPCPVDGEWTVYSDWGTCSVSCGGGVQTRARTCSNPTPAYGGMNCTGISEETRSCGNDTCPIHGGWSAWGDYSLCDTNCEKVRHRTCTNPAPQHGGRDCEGSGEDVDGCSLLQCPVDGQWSEWTILSCDETCRGRKTRSCNNPPPLRGGADCVGASSEEYGECTGFRCVQNGAWSDWSHWSKCSKSCDRGGVVTRHRHCTNPRPKNGGKDCPVEDPSEETKSCFLYPCPVPPDYVRHVVVKKSNVNWALILSIIFGLLAVFTVALIVGLCFRRKQLARKRKEMLEEREKDKLYKEAAEMSILPEGKRSVADKLRRQQLKAKLKKNGNLEENAELLGEFDEDGSLLDDFWKTRPDSAGSLSRSGSLRSQADSTGYLSRSGSLRSRSGSTRSRPGSAAHRTGSTGSEGEENGMLLEGGPDAEPRSSTWNPDEATFEIPEDPPLETPQEVPVDQAIAQQETEPVGSLVDPAKPRRMRRRKRRPGHGHLHRVTATIENEESAFDLPQDATDADRVATPDMMQQLMQLDAQLKQMADHQVTQNSGVTGGLAPAFTGLTDILGADLSAVMQAPTGKAAPGMTHKQDPTIQSTGAGMSLSQAMAAKSPRGQGMSAQAPVAGAAARPSVIAVQPSSGTPMQPPPEANRVGMNMQQAMGGKGANQGPLPSQQPQQPTGGMTLQQATGGKGAGKPGTEQPARGISLEQAFGTAAGKPQAAKQDGQQQQQQLSPRGGPMLDQATGGKNASRPRSAPRGGMTLEQATDGKNASRPRSAQRGGMTMEQATGGKRAAPPRSPRAPRTPQNAWMTAPQPVNRPVSPRLGAGFTSSVDANKDRKSSYTGGSMTLQQAMGPKLTVPTGVNRSKSYDSIIREAMGSNHGKAQDKAPRRMSTLGITRERSDLNEFSKHYGELSKQMLDIEKEIGEGSYGSIYRAWVELPDKDEEVVVVVKALNRDVNAGSRGAFMREIETMKKLKAHPNVIAFVACCTKSDPCYMIMEYASKGPLQTFLRRNRPGVAGARPPPAEIFLRFAVHVARGMAFIQSQRVVVGDLTTRTILLNDYLRAKVNNLARDRNAADNIVEGGIRWMSPESISSSSFTTSSDVWSFGVLLWELVCFAATPYTGMTSLDVRKKTQSGFRLEQPPQCSNELYSVMQRCWHEDPFQRPSFTSLVIDLESLTPETFIDVNKFNVKNYDYQ